MFVCKTRVMCDRVEGKSGCRRVLTGEKQMFYKPDTYLDNIFHSAVHGDVVCLYKQKVGCVFIYILFKIR